jgi:hypothetical protein
MSDAVNRTRRDGKGDFSDLEERVRDLSCMASIAGDLIGDLQIKRPETDRIVVEMSEAHLNRLVFLVLKTADMAEDLHKAYLARFPAEAANG